MQIAKRLARTGLHRMRGLEAMLWWTRHDFRVLTYHRFSPHLYPGVQQELDRQCAFLKRHFRVTPLSEIAAVLNSGAAVPPNTLAVTIDDGYRDVLTTALPVFEKWKIPAMVYLISDFLDAKMWPWWDQVSYAVHRTRRENVCIGDNGDRLNLRTTAEKNAAIEAISNRMKRLRHRELLLYVQNLPKMFEVEIPSDPPPESAPLSWPEARRLTEAGIELGAHTKTHPILPNLETEDEMREEIAGSKKRIEQELGREVVHFCYPNGGWNEAAEAAVESSGFITAVTTESGLNAAHVNRYRLKRLSVEPGLSREYYREQVAGLHARDAPLAVK